MTLHVASGLPARVNQVLKDFLPAELDLVDSEEGEFDTPDVASGSYHEWDRPLITSFPAVALKVIRARPIDTKPDFFGRRFDAWYEVDVKFHVAIGSASADDALRLQKLCFRYTAAALRVLCMMKNQLQTNGDPTEYAKETVVRSLEFGPQEGQESGQQTRTAILGIDVRKIEARG